MEWFEDWFDTRYYHLLYNYRDEREAELFIDKLLDNLHPSPESRFLDLCCGKGRHSLYLNKKGFMVTGIDLSAQNIAHAKQYENERLSFYIQDMRKTFCVNGFDYVFNLFTSFGYFENEKDNVNSVRTIANALKKGGHLVLDYMNSSSIKTCIAKEELREEQGIKFKVSKEIKDGFIIKHIEVNDKGKKLHYKEKVRLLSLGDFENYFAKNKLKITSVFGDYKLNNYIEQESDRLILIVVKE